MLFPRQVVTQLNAGLKHLAPGDMPGDPLPGLPLPFL